MHALIFALAVVAAVSASTLPPDTTSLAPPGLDTDTPNMITDTEMPVTDTSDITTSDMMTNQTEPPTNSTPSIECTPSLEEIQAVFNYTNALEFKELSENQQILIYELLASGEACKLAGFITPATSQRIFLLLEDLPLKYVYLFISFLARNLEKEGIVVPV